jgi:hypothetical protein
VEQVGVREVGVAEVRPAEVRVVEGGVAEVRTPEVRVPDIGVGEVGIREVGVREVDVLITKVAVAQVGPRQVRSRLDDVAVAGRPTRDDIRDGRRPDGSRDQYQDQRPCTQRQFSDDCHLYGRAPAPAAERVPFPVDSPDT